jgi:hypothetical protein
LNLESGQNPSSLPAPSQRLKRTLSTELPTNLPTGDLHVLSAKVNGHDKNRNPQMGTEPELIPPEEIR